MKTEIIRFLSSTRCSLLASALLAFGLLPAQNNSYTFTNAGATGNVGPTQGAINTSYANTSLFAQVTVVTQGVQEWVVPITGPYSILALGAQGYGGNFSNTVVGGRGAKMYGEFNLTAGQVLRIIVGQQGVLPSGVNNNAQFGGGGGSFVADASNTPLIVAGGGGGNWTSTFSAVSDATTGTTGNAGAGLNSTGASGGINGSGGNLASHANGGGGFLSNGQGAAGGVSFVNGGLGGYTYLGIGGFGGGGGTSNFPNRHSAGGGGYSGGGGSSANNATSFPEGGGGGSFNAGTNQNNASGFNSGMGMVVIKHICNVTASVATNPICQGSAVTLSTNAITTTSWSAGSPSNSSSISVSPTITTSYSVTGTGTNGCVHTAVVVVTVMPAPQLNSTAIPSVVCSGATTTLFAFGAGSYTWGPNANSSTLVVNPGQTTVYTFTGSTAAGCQKTGSVSVAVKTVSLSVLAATPICSGKSATLVASGADTYSWSNGVSFQTTTVSPVASTIYTVTGTDDGCVSNATVLVTVNPSPVLTATADRSVICRGESVNLTAGGASTYQWSNGSPGSAISITPALDVTYNFGVTGTAANGCTAQAVVSVVVSRCTAIDELNASQPATVVYPNPATTSLFLNFSTEGAKEVYLFDLTGREQQHLSFDGTQGQIDLSTLSRGVYYLRVVSGTETENLKVVKQ